MLPAKFKSKEQGNGERQGKSLPIHQGLREMDFSQSAKAAAEAALTRRVYDFGVTRQFRRNNDFGMASTILAMAHTRLRQLLGRCILGGSLVLLYMDSASRLALGERIDPSPPVL